MGFYESPEYQVVETFGDIEIRKYSAYSIVTYDNPGDRNSSQGFSSLFSYISKGNESEEKISMTVPVIDEKKQDRTTMSFVVPSRFNREDIPLPKSDFLSVRVMEEGYFAAIRFRGNPTSRRLEENEARLKDFVRDKGYKELSNYYNAFYDPPFQLPFVKRNDIMVRIDYKEK